MKNRYTDGFDANILKFFEKYKGLDVIYNQGVLRSVSVIRNLETIGSIHLHNFIRQLKTEKRFFCQHKFFTILDEHFEQFFERIDAGTLLYRARRMNEHEYDKRKDELCSCNEENFFKGFSEKDSFVPPIEKTVASRANSNGIPCLYVADSVETAISEVRPFKGTYVSVATIEVKKPLTLFKLRVDTDDLELSYKPFIEKYPDWYRSLRFMFSIPYENCDNNEYLVTQCISEYVRLSGKFDGILFESSLSDKGTNYAIFNCEHEDYSQCEPISSKIYSITNINVCFEGYNGY